MDVVEFDVMIFTVLSLSTVNLYDIVHIDVLDAHVWTAWHAANDGK